MGDIDLMFIANQLQRTYWLSQILVYPLTQLPAYSKDFLQELPKSVLKKYLRVEIEHLTNIFWENGHDRKTLQKIINSFEKKTCGPNNNNNNSNTNKKQTITLQLPKRKKEI